jgi:O-antigen ligase
MLFGGGSALSSALGRGSGLSGRTDIWGCAIGAASNPVIGTGFESFWNANAANVSRCLMSIGFLDMSNLVSAHDGYIEVYLDMGLVGVCLLMLVLMSGYRRAVEAFRRDRELGGLILAYIVTGVFYSITEAGFRLLSPSWIFPLLAIVSATGVTIGLFAEKSKIPASGRQSLGLRGGQTVYAPKSGVTPI